MNRIFGSFILLAFVGIGGCTSMGKPSLEIFDTVPEVQFGDNVPEGGEFILHFPAGKPIPVVARIKGSAFSEEAENTLHVTLKKDIYAYKHWVSFDRKIWHRSDQAMGFNVEVRIPSPEHPKPGLMKIQVDLK